MGNVLQTGEKPRVGIATKALALYFFLVPLDFVPLLGGSVSKLLAAIPFLGLVMEYREIKFSTSKEIGLLIAYFLYCAITMLFSQDMTDSISKLITLFLNIALIVVITGFRRREAEVAFLEKAMVYSGWLTLILLLVFARFEYNRIWLSIGGEQQDPNYLCGYFIFAIAFYLKRFIFEHKKSAIVCLLIFLTVILMTGSRGGSLSLVAVVLFSAILWLYRTKKTWKESVRLILILAVIAAAIVYILTLLPVEVTQRFSFEYIEKDKGAGRFDIWNNLIEQFKCFSFPRQLFGTGLGTIFLFSNKVAHNLWIEMLVETGWIGLGLLTIVYLAFLLRAFKEKADVMLIALMGYITMTFSLSLTSYKPVWNVFMMIIIFFHRYREEERK